MDRVERAGRVHVPSAAPYFNKASIESGPGIRVYPVESAIATSAAAPLSRFDPRDIPMIRSLGA